MRSVKHQPSTALPFRFYEAPLRPQFPVRVTEIHGGARFSETVVKWGGFDGLDISKKAVRQNVRYIVHASNAYQPLVEKGRHVTQLLRRSIGRPLGFDEMNAARKAVAEFDALVRALGEAP